MPEREPAQLIAGWEVGGRTAPNPAISFGELGCRREAWLDVAAAIACWPGLSPTVERRFLVTRSGVREFVLATTHGADRIAAQATLAELAALLGPILRRLAVRSLKQHELADLLSLATEMKDVAEVRCVSDQIPEGPRSFGTSLIRLLNAASLTTALGKSILISFMLSTAGPPAERDEDLPFPFLQLKGLGPRRHERPGPRTVRFRLRLAASTCLPASVVAIAGTMALAPDELAGDGWSRACGPLARQTAQTQLRTLGVVPWDSPELDDGASTGSAATMFSLPMREPIQIGHDDPEDVNELLEGLLAAGQTVTTEE
jgi:hypothetical protein